MEATLEIKPLAKGYSSFYWQKMNECVKKWDQNYEIYQRNKSGTVPYPKLLQPLKIQTRAWQDVSMDFIEAYLSQKGRIL